MSLSSLSSWLLWSWWGGGLRWKWLRALMTRMMSSGLELPESIQSIGDAQQVLVWEVGGTCLEFTINSTISDLINNSPFLDNHIFNVCDGYQCKIFMRDMWLYLRWDSQRCWVGHCQHSTRLKMQYAWIFLAEFSFFDLIFGVFWQLFSFRKDEEGRFDALSTFLLLRQNKIFSAKYADGGRKKNLTRS